MSPRRAVRRRGFTLIEVLVALVIMAVLAGMAWRGVDGMMRTREGTQASLERTTRLVTVMTQWEQDLRAVFDDPSVPAIAFDGQTLRLARRADGGARMVAWALREGQWMRWMSPVTTRANELQEHWLRSQQLLGNESGQLQLLDGVDEWQVYFYRGGQRSNAQSTGEVAAPPAAAASGVAREALPQGVELVLKLQGQTLTRLVPLVPQS